jgi:hypothetical protein
LLASFSLFFYFTNRKEENESLTTSRFFWNQLTAILPLFTGGFDFADETGKDVNKT